MKKITLIFLLATVIVCFASAANAARYPKPGATAALLMDADSGEIIYAKNARTPLAPASTTKIMTAILALEHLNLNSKVTIQPTAAGKEGSSMYLNHNEKLTVRELIYGLLLVSGNDAATAIAEAVSGNEARFAALMTFKAKQLGMYDTNFKNASGLPEKGHVSTAYDMAILTRYAMNNGNFKKIFGTKVKEVTGSKPGEPRRLINHNKLLWQYPYTTGGKTGYTRAAGGCLVSTASREQQSLIAVVLKTSYKYDDSKQLFDYGFAKLLKKGKHPNHYASSNSSAG
ncbi:MAG TPA: D-alanyl-D-alanine carboxypeptidase family protein [Bacillota bacterium]|nr:D-alanyl-D-alanine carboxypeptidase family protein [Bacillota bacterium]